LEDRDCPSTITLSASFLPHSRYAYWGGQVTNTPDPGGLTVQLSGVVNGTAVTNSNGTFLVYLQATGLGTAYAATTDGQSNTAQFAVTDPSPPQINQFASVEYPNGMFEFSGHVNGGYKGEVVTLGGIQDLQGKTATLDANGNFIYMVVLDGQPNDNGTATAQATDQWGVASNLATDYVTQT
jgi:hypothetical protein